ncbi:chemotaxis protein CheA [Candidatus Magnetomorum sp. HK-1]|nr:chemotaxis protein CheA [Candidatus Magnetomorum sp. HK-1]
MVEESLLNEFVIESKEHLKTIEDDFLNMEKNMDNLDPSIIDRVFRSVHTIKGSSGFLALTNIKELAHTIETFLSMIRAGEIKSEPIFIDALLSGVDYLNVMLDDIENSNNIDISEILNRLNTLLEKTIPSETKKALDTSVELSNIHGEPITDLNLNEFTMKNLTKDILLYILKFDLIEIATKDNKSPVKLIKLLLKNGEILDAKIDTPADDMRFGIPDEPLLYEVLYSTSIDYNDLCNLVKLDNENIIRVSTENFTQKETVSSIEHKTVSKKSNNLPLKNLSESLKCPDPILQSLLPTKLSSDANRTIRVNVNIIDKLMILAGEFVLVRNQKLLSMDNSDATSRSIAQRLDNITTELQETVMQTRMQSIENIFGKFPRIVHELGEKLNKKIKISISGKEVELDKTILESLTDPLTHIIRNSCDHGIEMPEDRLKAGKLKQANIFLSAYHEAGQITIMIKDDGKGIDPEKIKKVILEKALKTNAELENMTDKEIISLILLPGFSTAKEVSDLSGRGVGMDVVKTSIEKLGGNIDIDSEVGKGTSLYLRLPLTLAIIPSLIVKVLGFRFAIPQNNVEEVVSLYDIDTIMKIEYAADNEVFRLRDKLLNMVRLEDLLLTPEKFTKEIKSKIKKHYRNIRDNELQKYHKDKDKWKEKNFTKSLCFAVLKLGERQFGLIVDSVIGAEEIVVKSMHPALNSLRIYAGATVMGDGKVALIMDVAGIAEHAGILFDSHSDESMINEEVSIHEEESQTVLLFKYGKKEQFAMPLPLIKRIEHIQTSKIEEIGDKEFITIDNVSTLIIRLDKVLNVSKTNDSKEMFLILPKHIERPHGLMISSIVGIKETSLNLNTESYKQEGILGTNIIDDHMTLFIDIVRLIEISENDSIDNLTQNPISTTTTTITTLSNNDTKNKGKKILLVEDSIFMQKLIKGYLEEASYGVKTANNGKEALEWLNSSDFDLMISDISMPEMDGITLINKIRNESSMPDIPVIALSSLDSQADIEKAKNAGFDEYEVKINRKRLIKNVEKLLNRKFE